MVYEYISFESYFSNDGEDHGILEVEDIKKQALSLKYNKCVRYREMGVYIRTHKRKRQGQTNLQGTKERAQRCKRGAI